jgi:hypothetical protein
LNIYKITKLNPYKILISPLVVYGAESWTRP